MFFEHLVAQPINFFLEASIGRSKTIRGERLGDR
jgi:hypothetical protein